MKITLNGFRYIKAMLQEEYINNYSSLLFKKAVKECYRNYYWYGILGFSVSNEYGVECFEIENNDWNTYYIE